MKGYVFHKVSVRNYKLQPNYGKDVILNALYLQLQVVINQYPATLKIAIVINKYMMLFG